MSTTDPARVREVVEALTAQKIDVVRLSYPDLNGIDRGRDILVKHLPTACEHGLSFCRAVYHVSTQGETVDVPGGLKSGLPDITLRPDLDTLVAIPWEPGVAWCLGDPIDATGRPYPESPRDLLRRTAFEFHRAGYSAVIGPELEYFLLDRDPATPSGWRRYADVPGAVYTVGRGGDPDGHLLRTLRHLAAFGVGVSTANHEFDPGQFEINLTHSHAVDAADRAWRFKSSIKQLAHAEGRLATFMAKPFNDGGGSGFHLHVSCWNGQGVNAFDDSYAQFGLSEVARHAIGGVLAHAPALAALVNPTINSYKRLGPDSLAPWLIDWGLDNRSAMLRIPPERGSGTRFELRLGDAAANPYLAMAAVIAAMLLGIRSQVQPPAPLEGYGYDRGRAPVLPMNLGDALDALEADHEMVALLGKDFVISYVAYKRDEIERFRRHVTEWEFREYAWYL